MKLAILVVAPALVLIAAAPTSATPAKPARFRGPEAIPLPLDLKLRLEQAKAAQDGAPSRLLPRDWCPSGPEFLRWLETRGLLDPAPASALGARKARTPAELLASGVVVMEDDGTMLRHDRRFDLEGRTLELRPSGAGYAVSALPLAAEADLGTPLFAGMQAFHAQPYDLVGFAFPFAGAAETRVQVSSTLTLGFATLAPPAPAQYHLSELITDRTPRVAPFQQGTSLYGWDAWVREWPDRVVFSWRGSDGLGLDVRVQAVLYADGRIRFHYPSMRGCSWGAPLVVTGNPAFWQDLAPGGAITHPPDVTIPAPDGPAIDVVAIRGSQIAGSELYQVEVEMAGPLPALTNGPLQLAFELRDEPGGDVFRTLWAEWENGAFNWVDFSPEIVGATLRFRLLRSDLPLANDDFEIVAWTAQSWNWVQAVPALLSFPTTPRPLMKDLSAAPLQTGTEPVIEAFTLPELLIGPVYDAFNRRFGSPRIDGLAVYQNFLTDIIFYAGAWSTVGNAGADGIGVGSASDPETPALLHMNEVNYGWNSWDEGRAMVLGHELGHHWLYFPSVMEGGVVGKPLGDGHPAGWTHTEAAFPLRNPYDASCMGGSSWTDHANGTFTSAPTFASFAYAWHELYLMGLAAPGEVAPWYYLANSVPALPGAYWPPDNTTVSATRVNVIVDQFIQAMGPRVPDASQSRKVFFAPLVLLVRPGEVTQADIDALRHICSIWAPAFRTATGGRASVTCDRVGYRPPIALITDPPADLTLRAGQSLMFLGQGSDPDEDTVSLAWDFGTLAPPAAGPGPHAVTFPDLGRYTISLRAQDATGMSSLVPDVRTVTVNCREPGPIDTLYAVRRPGGVVEVSWAPVTPAPDEFVLLAAAGKSAGFTEQTAGPGPFTIPAPPANTFYRVAARNRPDCLGPH